MPSAPATAPAGAIPARSSAEIRLEQAILQRLFQGPSMAGAADPDGTEWQQARTQAHRPSCGEVGPLRYLSRAVDLNDDGRPEQVVAVLGSYACGSRGCTLLVFRRSEAGEEPAPDLSGPQGTGLRTVAELDLFQSPLWLTSRRQAGWRELLLPAPLDQGPPLRLVWQPGSGRYELSHEPGGADAAAGGLTPLLEVEALPFEQLGRPLACNP